MSRSAWCASRNPPRRHAPHSFVGSMNPGICSALGRLDAVA
jgi:hypothetical protein